MAKLKADRLEALRLATKKREAAEKAAREKAEIKRLAQIEFNKKVESLRIKAMK